MKARNSWGQQVGSDYIGFYSGEAASGNKPELVIVYQ